MESGEPCLRTHAAQTPTSWRAPSGLYSLLLPRHFKAQERFKGWQRCGSFHWWDEGGSQRPRGWTRKRSSVRDRKERRGTWPREAESGDTRGPWNSSAWWRMKRREASKEATQCRPGKENKVWERKSLARSARIFFLLSLGLQGSWDLMINLCRQEFWFY